MIRRFAGFTVIELVIVVVIIGVVSAVAFIAWPGRRINAYAQAERLASDIRYVQNLAMTKHQRYRINFVSTTQYTLTDNGSNGVAHPSTGSSTITLDTGITLSTNGLSNGFIAFASSGIPFSGTSTELSSTATIILSTSSGASGNTYTVSIAPQTGRVSVS